MLKTVLVLSVLSLVVCSGCTNKQVYEATQQKFDHAQCMKLPRSQYDECIQRELPSYENYERESKEISDQ